VAGKTNDVRVGIATTDSAPTARRSIYLALGGPGYGPPDSARASGARVLVGTDVGSHYAPPHGLDRLRIRLAERVRERYGIQAKESWITVTTGASTALTAAILALTDPGDAVLCPDPGYPAYGPLVSHLGRIVSYYRAPSRAEGDEATVEAIGAALSDRSRLLIWNSPSNPTGFVAGQRLVACVAALAEEQNLVLLSDESYEDIVFDGVHSSPGRHVPDRFCGVYSFSKSFGMAGWRIGYVVAEPERADAIGWVHYSISMNAPTIAQYAALGALAAPPDYQRDLLSVLRGRRDAASAILARYGVLHELPAGGYFLWLDVRATGLTSADFVARCEEETLVALMPGSYFGPSGEGFARLNFAAREEDVMDGAHQVGEFCASFR
jgi:aspartate/methionine/tyrosine aminotransferase